MRIERDYFQYQHYKMIKEEEDMHLQWINILSLANICYDKVNNEQKTPAHKDNFMIACLDGDIDIIKDIFSLDNNYMDYFMAGLSEAIKKDFIHVIDFLFIYNDNYKNISISQYEQLFQNACEKNQLDLVKYFLNSPFFKEISALLDYNSAFKKSIHTEINDVTRFLLTSPMTKSYIYIHFQNDYVLRCAFYEEKMELIHYLLTSPELKEHADIHANKDEIFRDLYTDKNYTMIEEIIFSYDFKNSDNISDIIENNSYISNMFNSIKMKNNLDNDLHHKFINPSVKLKL